MQFQMLKDYSVFTDHFSDPGRAVGVRNLCLWQEQFSNVFQPKAGLVQ